MEFTDVDRRRRLEIVLQAVFVEKIECRRGIDDKNVDLVLLGGLDNRLVALEKHQIVDPSAPQQVDGGIALLDGDDESPQGIGGRDRADGLVEISGHLDARMGLAEIEPGFSLLGFE